jgi:hypothetical protein
VPPGNVGARVSPGSRGNHLPQAGGLPQGREGDLIKTRFGWVKWTMLVFLAMGWLLYVAFLLGVLVLACIVWCVCKLVLWLTDPKLWLAGPPPAVGSRPKAAPVPRKPKAVPLPQRAKVPQVPHRAKVPPVSSDIWPKWTPARRQYMDRELSLWQEQFDALNSRE